MTQVLKQPVTLRKPRTPRSGDLFAEAYTWEVDPCVICGGEHSHGAGRDIEKVRTLLGGRVPHCRDGKGDDYHIELVAPLVTKEGGGYRISLDLLPPEVRAKVNP